MQNTDVILNIGSNSVENHPVSAKWLHKAHEKGAKWVVVDPRYTRTAEQADIYCPLRSGTDIAFYGGLYNYIIEHLIEPGLDAYLKKGTMTDYNFEYLLNYTNASYILNEHYEFDPETGLFSGWNEDSETYDAHSWHYETEKEIPWDTSEGGAYHWSVGAGVPKFDKPVLTVPKKDTTLKNKRCVYQQFKQHYSRYDLDTVCKVCGMTEKTSSWSTRPGASPAHPASPARSSTLWARPSTPTAHRTPAPCPSCSCSPATSASPAAACAHCAASPTSRVQPTWACSSTNSLHT